MNQFAADTTAKYYDILPGCNCCKCGLFPIRKKSDELSTNKRDNKSEAIQSKNTCNSNIILYEPGEYVILYVVDMKAYQESGDLSICWKCNEQLLEDTKIEISFDKTNRIRIKDRFCITCNDERKEIGLYFTMEKLTHTEFTGSIKVTKG